MPTTGITVAGNPSPIRISESREQDLLSGLELRQTWRGERNSMFSFFPALANNAARASIRQEGAVATAEISLKDLTTVTETVEVSFNSVTRSWYTAPVYASLSQSDIATVLGKLKELQTFASDEQTPAAIAARQAAIVAQLGALGPVLDDLVLNGDTYNALLPVLTYTRNVSAFFGDPFIIVDIGKVFSTQAMLNQIPIPPNVVIDEVTNTIAANSLQTLGWLKNGSASQTSDGSFTYVQTYTFDSYPTSRYTFIS